MNERSPYSYARAALREGYRPVTVACLLRVEYHIPQEDAESLVSFVERDLCGSDISIWGLL